LASRHFSLDLSEVMDTITTIRSYEEHSQVKLVVAFSVVQEGKTPSLFLTATAYPPAAAFVELAPLACVQLSSSGTNLKHLRDVLTHLLYLLDAKLAWKEMTGEG